MQVFMHFYNDHELREVKHRVITSTHADGGLFGAVSIMGTGTETIDIDAADSYTLRKIGKAFFDCAETLDIKRREH